jgi:hypothetical protein
MNQTFLSVMRAHFLSVDRQARCRIISGSIPHWSTPKRKARESLASCAGRRNTSDPEVLYMSSKQELIDKQPLVWLTTWLRC